MRQDQSRVLIVDDEAFFVEAIDEILTTAGFLTRRAADGASALQQASDPSVGVVVLDVRLPGIDGIQVLARLRESRPELPVIMLSASTDQEVVLEALRLGACDYLAKPLHDEELTLAVGRALSGFETNTDRLRLRRGIDLMVEEMEDLALRVREVPAGARAEAIRTGVVEAAAGVFQTSRVSLMLADAASTLTVVAVRGASIEAEEMSARKPGEGPAGLCFAECALLCVSDVDLDPRCTGSRDDRYATVSFACVPLKRLGEPIGVLCMTHGAEDGLFVEQESLLRLLGLQVSEFLAQDPEVEARLGRFEEVSAHTAHTADRFDLRGAVDGDAELARVVCESVALEVEPERVLRAALKGVAARLSAAPVSLYLRSPEGDGLRLEAEDDGGTCPDRSWLPLDRGLLAGVARSGQLVAVDEPGADPRFDAGVDTPASGQPGAMICVPLRLREESVGVLRVFLGEGREASPRTAEVLGAAFSAALRNVLLYRSLLQSIEEVAEARKHSLS